MGSSNTEIDRYHAFASSTYQDRNDDWGPWRAFDNNRNTFWHTDRVSYNVNTGQYGGIHSVNFVNSTGQHTTVKGEFLQLNLPEIIEVAGGISLTTYEIRGRHNCCGSPNGRDPNTWYILGWTNGGWNYVDYQSNISFNWQMRRFEIQNPKPYSAYMLLVSVAGDPSAPEGSRNSVQVATWNLYKNDNLISFL